MNNPVNVYLCLVIVLKSNTFLTPPPNPVGPPSFFKTPETCSNITIPLSIIPTIYPEAPPSTQNKAISK